MDETIFIIKAPSDKLVKLCFKPVPQLTTIVILSSDNNKILHDGIYNKSLDEATELFKKWINDDDEVLVDNANGVTGYIDKIKKDTKNNKLLVWLTKMVSAIIQQVLSAELLIRLK